MRLWKYVINVSLVLVLALFVKTCSGQEYDDPGSIVCRRKRGMCMSQPGCCYSGEYKRNICKKTPRSVCCYTWNTCLKFQGYSPQSQGQAQMQSQAFFGGGLPLFQNPQPFLGLGGGGGGMPMQKQFAPQTDFKDSAQTLPKQPPRSPNRGLLNQIHQQTFFGALFTERN